MTSINEHKKKINEHLESINDAINQGIEKKPISIGFNCSACALQLLELYLHITNKIDIGKIIKHDWFKKPHENQKKEPLIDRKLKVEFPKKELIYSLIYELEENRNILLYGKSTKEQIEKTLKIFNTLKKELEELTNGES
ncbi:MAG: hypothetical protein AABX11_02045 [Nanoarchaeota archaeon]